jgi:hypothetical protein
VNDDSKNDGEFSWDADWDSALDDWEKNAFDATGQTRTPYGH